LTEITTREEDLGVFDMLDKAKVSELGVYHDRERASGVENGGARSENVQQEAIFTCSLWASKRRQFTSLRATWAKSSALQDVRSPALPRETVSGRQPPPSELERTTGG